MRSEDLWKKYSTGGEAWSGAVDVGDVRPETSDKVLAQGWIGTVCSVQEILYSTVLGVEAQQQAKEGWCVWREREREGKGRGGGDGGTEGTERTLCVPGTSERGFRRCGDGDVEQDRGTVSTTVLCMY